MLHQINPQIPNFNESVCLRGIVVPSKQCYYLAIDYQMSQIRDLWVYFMQHDHNPILFRKFFQQSLILNLKFNLLFTQFYKFRHQKYFTMLVANYSDTPVQNFCLLCLYHAQSSIQLIVILVNQYQFITKSCIALTITDLTLVQTVQ